MIENIRKYTGLMIVVFVTLFISFLFLDTPSVGNMSGGHAVMKIAGRTYTDKEYRSLGTGSFELTRNLASAGDFGLYQFLMGLSSGATSEENPTEIYQFLMDLSSGAISEENAAEKFFVGRMIIRQAKEEFGIHPGKEEVSAYLRSLRIFAGPGAGPEKQFDAEAYRNFIEKGMGRLGMTERDLRELAADVLASKKINAIVGAGLSADREAVAKDLALQNQQISGEVAKLELAPLQEKIQPTEEEIKKYWETVSDSFTTEPRRKFTYIIASPSLPPAPKADVAVDSLIDAAASDDAKKAAAKAKEDANAKRAAEYAEECRKKQLELDKLVDDFSYQLGEQKGSGFEELAAQNKWEVKTSDFFPRSAPPQQLDIKLRASSKGSKLADELYHMEPTTDPLSKISQPIAVGENQWVIARIDGEEKSRTKTYEEARDDARAQYISVKALEAMKAAANDAATKIKASLAAGKSFTEAAKEAGLSESKVFSAITSTTKPEEVTQPKNLFTVARNVDPGTLADVINEADRSFILYVAKREVVKKADAAANIDSEVASRANENETIAFMSWIAARTEAAKVEQLDKR